MGNQYTCPKCDKLTTVRQNFIVPVDINTLPKDVPEIYRPFMGNCTFVSTGKIRFMYESCLLHKITDWPTGIILTSEEISEKGFKHL
jgi:hypothetical protein